jgi:hypothetical protein
MRYLQSRAAGRSSPHAVQPQLGQPSNHLGITKPRRLVNKTSKYYWSTNCSRPLVVSCYGFSSLCAFTLEESCATSHFFSFLPCPSFRFHEKASISFFKDICTYTYTLSQIISRFCEVQSLLVEMSKVGHSTYTWRPQPDSSHLHSPISHRLLVPLY